MADLGRRRFLKKTSLLASAPIVVGFPSLFSAAQADDKPPKPTKKSKETVSKSKPKSNKSTKKTD